MQYTSIQRHSFHSILSGSASLTLTGTFLVDSMTSMLSGWGSKGQSSSLSSGGPLFLSSPSSSSSRAVPLIRTLSTWRGTSGMTHFSTATTTPRNTENPQKKYNLTTSPLSEMMAESRLVLEVMSSALVPTLRMEKRARTSFQVPSPSLPLGLGRCDEMTRLVASTLSSKMLLMMASSGMSGKAITNSVT